MKLTDERISDLWFESTGREYVTEDTHVFGRAIEAEVLRGITGDGRGEAVAWLFVCEKPGRVETYATVDENDTLHYPVDQWTSIEKFNLYATPPQQEQAAPGAVQDGFVMVPVEPPYPKQYITLGVRTENGVSTTVYLTYTDEGGGWYQWTNSKAYAKRFPTEKAALANANGCPGPWYYLPDKATIRAEPIENSKAAAYRAMIAAAPKVGETPINKAAQTATMKF